MWLLSYREHIIFLFIKIDDISLYWFKDRSDSWKKSIINEEVLK